MPKLKTLRCWNGRTSGVRLRPEHREAKGICVAAYSRADARRLVAEYLGRGEAYGVSDSEIKNYWWECWGDDMDNVVPERGIWLVEQKGVGDPPVRVFPVGAGTTLRTPERIEVDRKTFEELCAKERLLEALEWAGINNCEAYSIGYQHWAAEEEKRAEADVAKAIDDLRKRPALTLSELAAQHAEKAEDAEGEMTASQIDRLKAEVAAFEAAEYDRQMSFQAALNDRCGDS
jgi:hypothetical protein